VSEFISNIAQAYRHSSPIPDSSESLPSLPFASKSVLSSPIRYVPPLCYATNPSIPAPAFNAPGPGLNLPPAPSPFQLPDASFSMPRQPAHLSDDGLSYIDEEPLMRPPPLPPCPYQASLQPPQHLLHTTFPPPQRPHSRALLQPPPMRLRTMTAAFATPAPAPTFTPAYGVGAMPSVRSRLTPRFTGDVNQPIEDFLEEYKELADKCGLTSLQKVETVIQYVDRSQRHVWQNLPGYIACDWLDFRDELCDKYVSPTPGGQFLRQKLINFATKYARKCMGDETDVINYQRQFNNQSKVLLGTGRITIGERNAIFWHGFHPEDQRALREHLIAMHPNMPQGQAFDLKDVFNIARAIFSGDDDFLLQEPSPHTDRTRMERSTPRDYSSPCIETRTVWFQNDAPEENKNELEGLIYQLHALPPRNPKYAVLYARCAARFPNHMMSIPRPEYQTDTAAAYSYSAPPPPPTWSAPAATPILTPAAPAANTTTATPFFFGPRPELCAFCCAEGHRLCSCASANEYLQTGCASWINDKLHLPNSQLVPFDGMRHGLKASIDAWLTAQSSAASPPAQTQAISARDPPLHLDSRNASARIEEVIESHILQVWEVATPDEEVFSQDIFEVFTAEKMKHPGKASEFSALPPPPPAPAPSTSAPAQPPAAASSAPQSSTQYQYHSDAEDQQLVTELEEYLMKGKLSLTTPAHVFAASHAVRKNIAKKLKVRRVETNEYEVVPAADPCSCLHRTTVHDDFSDDPPLSDDRSPEFCLPLLELNALVNSSFKSPAILDTGSQIVVIRHDIVQSLGFPINSQRLIKMEGANGTTNWTVGCAENLPLQVGDVTIKVHPHVVEHASFGLLLGRPFQKSALLRFEDLPSGGVEVSVCDPTNLECRVFVPTRPHTGRAPAVSVVSVLNLVPSLLRPMQATVHHLIPPLMPATHSVTVPKYTQPLPTKHPLSLVSRSSPEVLTPPLNTGMGDNFLTQHIQPLHDRRPSTRPCTDDLASSAIPRLSSLLRPFLSSAFHRTSGPCFDSENADADINDSSLGKARQGDFSLGSPLTCLFSGTNCAVARHPSGYPLPLASFPLEDPPTVAIIDPACNHMQVPSLVSGSAHPSPVDNCHTIPFPDPSCAPSTLRPPSPGQLEHLVDFTSACASPDCSDVALTHFASGTTHLTLPADSFGDEQRHHQVDPGGSKFKAPGRCKVSIVCALGSAHSGPRDACIAVNDSTRQCPAATPSHTTPPPLCPPLSHPSLDVSLSPPRRSPRRQTRNHRWHHSPHPPSLACTTRPHVNQRHTRQAQHSMPLALVRVPMPLDL